MFKPIVFCPVIRSRIFSRLAVGQKYNSLKQDQRHIDFDLKQLSPELIRADQAYRFFRSNRHKAEAIFKNAVNGLDQLDLLQAWRDVFGDIAGP